jgi:hypothetical protein
MSFVRWTSARKSSEDAQDIFRNQCAGFSWELTTAQTFLIWSLSYIGDLAEIKCRIPVLCREAQDKGKLYALTNHLSFGGILLDITDGKPNEGFAKVDELSRGWSSCGSHVQRQNLWGQRVHLLQYVRRSEEAWTEAHAGLRQIKRSVLYRIHFVRIMALFLVGKAALSFYEDSQNPRILADARQIARLLERGCVTPKSSGSLIVARRSASRIHDAERRSTLGQPEKN